MESKSKAKTEEEKNEEIRKNIKLKYDELNRLQQHSSRILEETFKPISKPLNEIKKYQVVDLSDDDKEIKKYDKEIKKEEAEDDNDDDSSVDYNAKFLELLQKKKSQIDYRYCFKRLRNQDGYLLGKHPARFEKNKLIIGHEEFKVTKGLFELLTMSEPTDYSAQDLRNYKKILDLTNIHRKRNSPTGKIIENSTPKYLKIIKQLYEGSGLFKTYRRKRAKIEYKYFDNPNELLDRLRVLCGEVDAGNISHVIESEILSILEELVELRLL